MILRPRLCIYLNMAVGKRSNNGDRYLQMMDSIYPRDNHIIYPPFFKVVTTGVKSP